jgi:NitT/TauT family transport system substrate-binding protein
LKPDTRSPISIALAVGVLVASGCGSSSVTTGAGRHVTLVVLPYLTSAPLFIADDEGDFRREGIEIEYVRLQEGVDGIPALLNGDIDVLGGSLTFGFFNLIHRGARIRAIAGKGIIPSGGCASQAILARRDLIAGGRLAAPAGRRLVASVNRASYTTYVMGRALQAAQLGLDDVDLVDLPQPLLVGSFESGRIDLAFVSEPWISAVLDTGSAAVWQPASALLPGFQYAFIFFGPNLLDREPGLGDRFIRAYLHGVRRFAEGKTTRNVDIIVARTGLDRRLVDRACWPILQTDAVPDIATVRDFQAWSHERGWIDAIAEPDAYWEPGFLDRARAAVPVTGR